MTANNAANQAAEEAVLKNLIEQIEKAKNIAFEIQCKRPALPHLSWIWDALVGINGRVLQARMVIRAFEIGAQLSADLEIRAELRDGVNIPDDVQIRGDSAIFHFNQQKLEEGNDLLSRAYKLGTQAFEVGLPWVSTLQRLLERAHDWGDGYVTLRCDPFLDRHWQGNASHIITGTGVTVGSFQAALSSHGIRSHFEERMSARSQSFYCPHLVINLF